MTQPDSPGPGWWLASDGRWYPPQTAPQTTIVVQQPPPKKKRSGGLTAVWVVLFVAIAVMLTWGCSSMLGGSSESSGSSASAEMACEHFRNVANDIVSGVLTDAEIRTKFKEVDSSASVADEQGVQDAGEALVRSATVGDPEDVLMAMGQMDAACDAVESGEGEAAPAGPPACTDMLPGTPVPESFSGCTLDGTLVPAGGLACPDGRQTYAVGTSPGVVGIEGGEWQPGVNEVEVLQALC